MMTLEMARMRELAGAGDGSAAPTSPLSRAERRAQFEREALVHLDAMYSFALKLARSRDDAEDLVSDTILRAFDRWEQYQLGTNVRAWLFTIVRNQAMSHLRVRSPEVLTPDELTQRRDSVEAYTKVGLPTDAANEGARQSSVTTWKPRPARTIELAVSCAPWMPWLYVRSAMSHAWVTAGTGWTLARQIGSGVRASAPRHTSQLRRPAPRRRRSRS